MRGIFLIAAGMLLLSGCATSSKTYAPDGTEAFSINCSGAGGNWGMCYEKAGDLCGTKGYEILSKDGDDGLTIAAGQNALYGGSVINRSLLIRCK